MLVLVFRVCNLVASVVALGLIGYCAFFDEANYNCRIRGLQFLNFPPDVDPLDPDGIDNNNDFEAIDYQLFLVQQRAKERRQG